MIILGIESSCDETAAAILEDGKRILSNVVASQVNVHKRVIVIDISEDKEDPMIFINPEFKILNDKSLLSCKEGCLSVPGIEEEITRPDNIYLTWQDIYGNKYEETPSGLLTVCIQHEIDHLKGFVFIDRMKDLKQLSYQEEFEKFWLKKEDALLT